MTIDSIHKKLLDQLKTAVLLLDSNLTLQFLNLAAEQLLEVSGRKAIGLTLGQLFIAADTDIAEIDSALSDNSSFTKREATLMLSQGKKIEIDLHGQHLRRRAGTAGINRNPFARACVSN